MILERVKKRIVKPAAQTHHPLTKAIPGTLQEGGAPFRTTHWSVVQLAADGESAEVSQYALSQFADTFWPPLYAFFRHRGYSSNDAQDLTQAFFAHRLERNTLSRVRIQPNEALENRRHSTGL